jgi:hypothetical protein
MKKISVAVAFLFYGSARMVMHAQGDTIISKALIEKAIVKFANILDSPDVANFGLKSIAQLKTLKGGKQFKRFGIGLYDLQKFKQGDKVKDIIQEYQSVEVSLVDERQNIVTSIEFTEKNGGWVVSGYGSTSELIAVKNAQTLLQKTDLEKGDLIRIPSLNLCFISISSPAGLEFISLQDNSDLNLFKRQRMSASDAIFKLVPFALEHKGLPPK